MDGDFTYFIGLLFILPLYLIIFIYRIDLIRKLLKVSLAYGIITTIFGKYIVMDYWHPGYIFNITFNIEDFLYGFWVCGVSSVLYHFVCKKRITYTKEKKASKERYLFLTFTILFTIITVKLLKLNSIWSGTILCLIIGLYTAIKRRDLIKPILISSTLGIILVFIWEFFFFLVFPNAVKDYWVVENLTNLFIYNIPIEELIFAFFFSFGGSFVYEYLKGYKLINYTK